ncbi:hypothetical protein ACJZ2D_010284 [Fusarium nematophilum]
MLTVIRKRFLLLNLALPFIVPKDAPAKVKKHKRSETTAIFLTGTAYFLLRNPESLKKLMLEVRSSFNSVDDITGDSPNALPYLRSVLEEGIRIFPPVSLGLPRTSSGATVDAQFIPPGVVVSVPPWVTQRDSRYWKEPESFRQERWPENKGQTAKEAFQPFSLGPRACIGINLAYLEMRVTPAKLVWMYDWELVNQDLDFLEEVRVYFMWLKPALFVRFHPRVTAS